MVLFELDKPSIDAPILNESPNKEFDLDTRRFYPKSSFDVIIYYLFTFLY